MALFGLILLLWGVESSMPDMASMQRDLDKLAEIQDPHSARLTDDNFHQVRDGSTWIINFCHPKAMHCKLLNVPWKTLAQGVEQEHLNVTIARVEPETGLSVFRAFGVGDVPTVLVVTEGYVYNYTGKLEPRQLTELLRNETYLMYDRRVLEPRWRDVRYWWRYGVWRLSQQYQDHPIRTVAVGLVSFLLCGWVAVYARRTHEKAD